MQSSIYRANNYPVICTKLLDRFNIIEKIQKIKFMKLSWDIMVSIQFIRLIILSYFPMVVPEFIISLYY